MLRRGPNPPDPFRDLTEAGSARPHARGLSSPMPATSCAPLASLEGYVEDAAGRAPKDDPAARERFLSVMSGQAERMIARWSTICCR